MINYISWTRIIGINKWLYIWKSGVFFLWKKALTIKCVVDAMLAMNRWSNKKNNRYKQNFWFVFFITSFNYFYMYRYTFIFWYYQEPPNIIRTFYCGSHIAGIHCYRVPGVSITLDSAVHRYKFIHYEQLIRPVTYDSASIMMIMKVISDIKLPHLPSGP